MHMKMTIECKSCPDKRRATTEFGAVENGRMGVLQLALPPGWEVRSGKTNSPLEYNRTVVTFMCAKCAKAVELTDEAVRALLNETDQAADPDPCDNSHAGDPL